MEESEVELQSRRDRARQINSKSSDIEIVYNDDDTDAAQRESIALVAIDSSNLEQSTLLPHSRGERRQSGRLLSRKRVTHLVLLLAGPLVFSLCFIAPGKEIPTAGLTLWVAEWWVAEVLPLGLTAFVPAVVLPLMGVCTRDEVTACYLNPTITLFLMSFLLADCVHKYNLHRRVALQVMLITGTRPGGILLGSMVITAALSMWMSNTATSAMMVPLVTSLYKTLFDEEDNSPEERNGHSEASPEPRGDGDAKGIKKFGKGLMLSVAYSASIGGTATLVGTGPNLVMMQAWERALGDAPGFLNWLGFGLSYATAMLAVLWVYLYFFFTSKDLPRATNLRLRTMLRDLGAYSFPEKVVTVAVLVVMLAWITRKKPLIGWGEWMSDHFGSSVHDYMPVMAVAIILAIIPERNPFSRDPFSSGAASASGHEKKGNGKILEMSAFRGVSWGVVFLLGGGFALSLGIEKSGLMIFISTEVEWMKNHVGRFVFPLLITLTVTFATELVSNVATASIILPILANIGAASANLGLIPATLASSCAFMLPSATPPNALAYGSGLLKVFPDMVYSGLVMNITGVCLITFWSIFVAPIFFPHNSTSL